MVSLLTPTFFAKSSCVKSYLALSSLILVLKTIRIRMHATVTRAINKAKSLMTQGSNTSAPRRTRCGSENGDSEAKNDVTIMNLYR